MGINVIALTWKGVFQRKVQRQTIVGHSRGGSDRRYSIWHCCNPMDRDRILLKESRNRTRLEKSGMHKYCRGASHFFLATSQREASVCLPFRRLGTSRRKFSLIICSLCEKENAGL